MTENHNKDHYANNLVEVNKSNEVRVTENIYNDKGALLISAGAIIKEEVVKRLISHKLAKPLENSIALEKNINGKLLTHHFSTYKSHPEILAIIANKLPVEMLLRESQKVEQYPLIVQKLTVMRERFPKLYTKTVFGAFLALLICRELSLDDASCHIVFVAALARDLGLLHIDPAVVGNTGMLSPAEWSLLQGHVAISYHLMSLVPNIPIKVRVAVLEHHERTDGFGYPRNKIEADLSLEGQIVAFSDMMIGLFNKYVRQMGYSLQSLVPIIQINSGIHKHQNAQATLRIFQRWVEPMKKHHTREQMSGYITGLTNINPLVNQLFAEVVAFNNDLAKEVLTDSLRRSTQMINSLQSVFISSGINDPSLLTWMQSLEPQQVKDEDVLELEKYGLMLVEGAYKLGELLKKLAGILQTIQLPDASMNEYVARFAKLNRLFANANKAIEGD
jgi:hypothetical protein